jgi:DNA-directed RNA polymerase subunit RPC12/RpoP
VAVFLTSLHYLGLVATAAALGGFFLRPSPLASRLLVAGLVFSAITWLISYFKRRAVHCPLCKGTPLINSGAMPHARARRLLPLNHGVSAVLSIMASQKFRCMYCGTDYDLLKPRTRTLPGVNEDEMERLHQDGWS